MEIYYDILDQYLIIVYTRIINTPRMCSTSWCDIIISYLNTINNTTNLFIYKFKLDQYYRDLHLYELL